MAVDLGRVVQNVGRLVREKVRKECSCVVSRSAKVVGHQSSVPPLDIDSS